MESLRFFFTQFCEDCNEPWNKNPLKVQPPFFIGWFLNQHYFSRGWSSSKRDHHFFNGSWRPGNPLKPTFFEKVCIFRGELAPPSRHLHEDLVPPTLGWKAAWEDGWVQCGWMSRWKLGSMVRTQWNISPILKNGVYWGEITQWS